MHNKKYQKIARKYTINYYYDLKATY
jgi:hypothetical protein